MSLPVTVGARATEIFVLRSSVGSSTLITAAGRALTLTVNVATFPKILPASLVSAVMVVVPVLLVAVMSPVELIVATVGSELVNVTGSLPCDAATT